MVSPLCGEFLLDATTPHCMSSSELLQGRGMQHFFLLIILIFTCNFLSAVPPKGAVLVTGGAGYIGTQTCKALHEAGYLPIAYDNLSTGHKEAVRWGILEIGDIGDAKRLSEVIDKYKPFAAIHFAALKSVGESVKDPDKYYRNNVSGSLTLFSVLREKGVKKVIFSSSATIYGNTITNKPIPEETPARPINPYGTTKWLVEQALQDFHEAYGWEYVIFRYFNAAGADLLNECGERGREPHQSGPDPLASSGQEAPLL